jgi:hypothetical protein
VAARSASLGHRDLATHPGAGLLNRLTRARVLRPNRLEPVEDVLRACCRPEGEELVIRIGEGPTAADRHETRVAGFREYHSRSELNIRLPEESRRLDAAKRARMFAFLRSTRPKGHKRPDPSVTLRLCDHVTALSALSELGDCFSDAIGLVSTRLGEFAERFLGLLMKPERSRLLHLVTASQLHDVLSVS